MDYAAVKERIRSFQTSDKALKRFFYYAALVAWKLSAVPCRWLSNPEYRSLVWLKYFKNKHAHQIANTTHYNRYPRLFSACRELMREKERLTILSYGCSTGEEAFTLKAYFPTAQIIGVDINTTNIKKANAKNKERDILFSSSIEKALAQYGPFDMIFALAVFQRTENRDAQTNDSSKIYPFEKFNSKVRELDRHLKNEGVFVIDNADYLFEDTDIYASYTTFTGEHAITRERYRFNKQNLRMSEYAVDHRIYIKKA